MIDQREEIATKWYLNSFLQSQCHCVFAFFASSHCFVFALSQNQSLKWQIKTENIHRKCFIFSLLFRRLFHYTSRMWKIRERRKHKNSNETLTWVDIYLVCTENDQRREWSESLVFFFFFCSFSFSDRAAAPDARRAITIKLITNEFHCQICAIVFDNNRFYHHLLHLLLLHSLQTIETNSQPIVAQRIISVTLNYLSPFRSKVKVCFSGILRFDNWTIQSSFIFKMHLRLRNRQRCANKFRSVAKPLHSSAFRSS